MDQMAAAAYGEETERLLLAFAQEISELEREVVEASRVRWESSAADAFRQGLAATVRGLPDASAQLRSAAAELQGDFLLLETGN